MEEITDRQGRRGFVSRKEILKAYFGHVDQYGSEELYRELEEECRKAEHFLPTRFREFENQSRADYYKVKSNFYFLFHLAERVKKEFYNHVGTLRVAASSQVIDESATTWIPVDK